MFDDSASLTGYARISEVARKLGLSDQTVRNLVRTGEIAPAVRIGGLYLIPRPTLESYLERATVNAPERAAA